MVRLNASGQVMLTSAFILAIILIFVALILNNVIYFNNISYIGFMDQSGYDDLSIKNLVAQEAFDTYEETHGDQSAFDAHMRDLVESLNANTLSKGIHVGLTRTAPVAPWDPLSSYVSTVSTLTISSKGSNKAYEIKTIFGSSPPAPPGPGSGALLCTVTMTANRTQLNVLEAALLTIKVINTSDSHPLAGVTVNLSASVPLGGFYLSDFSSDGSQVVTDSTGTAIVYYKPTHTGDDHLSASVGMNPSLTYHNRSADVVITSIISSPCDHDIVIRDPGVPVLDANGKKFSVSIPILVPAQTPDYDFTSFSVGAVFNDAPPSSNTYFLSPSDMGNFTVSGHVQGSVDYNRNIVVKLGVDQKNTPYTASITLIVTAHCVIDNSQRTVSRTVTVSGH